MGTPTQSGGPTTSWSPDGTYPTFPLELPNDGTLWNFDRVMLLVAELINAAGWLKNFSAGVASQGSPDGTAQVGVGDIADANNQGLWSASTLRDLLVSLWQNKGGLAKANVWAGTNSHSANVTMDAELIVNGTLRQSTANDAGRHIRRMVTLTDSSQTIDVKNDVYRCSVPTADRVLTLRSSTAPIPSVGELVWVYRPPTGAFKFDLQREGGQSIVELDASSWAGALLGFNNASWELVLTAGGVTVNNPI